MPLLKTIEYRLKAVDAQLEARIEALKTAGERIGEAAGALGRHLNKAMNTIGDLSVALASGFKFKLSPLSELIGLDIEMSPKETFDSAHEAADRAKAARQQEASPARAKLNQAARRESLYFDSDSALKEVTGRREPGVDGVELNLVVLIDDLDRCLPEKAIQVLESVKLFLNVPGFSFVLAVDDEVVERGISHRYRDYLLAAVHPQRGAPISGAEYLEKIVHLPVHLPRWTERQAREFLIERYPQLFGTPAPEPAESSAALSTESARKPDAVPREAQDLLHLIVRSVPLVPRKLVRLAEALEFHQRQFDALNARSHWRPRHMARLLALQQLYPSLYRHVRLQRARYWRLFKIRRNRFGEPEYENGNSLHLLRQQHETRAQEPSAHGPTAGARVVEVEFLAEQLGLLERIHEFAQLRGAPDPCRLFWDYDDKDQASAAADAEPEWGFEDFAQLYIHGLPLRPSSARPVDPAVESKRPLASIADVDMFLSRMLGADAIGRREYLEQQALAGTRLPPEVFERAMAQLKEADLAPRLGDIGWLRDLASLLSPEQLFELYRRHAVLDKLLAATTSPT